MNTEVERDSGRQELVGWNIQLDDRCAIPIVCGEVVFYAWGIWSDCFFGQVADDGIEASCPLRDVSKCGKLTCTIVRGRSQWEKKCLTAYRLD